MQIYPHKAKINANIASIYAIINPKNAPEMSLRGILIGLLYLASIPCYHSRSLWAEYRIVFGSTW